MIKWIKTAFLVILCVALLAFKRGKRGYLPQVHSRKGRSGELEDLIWGMAG